MAAIGPNGHAETNLEFEITERHCVTVRSFYRGPPFLWALVNIVLSNLFNFVSLNDHRQHSVATSTLRSWSDIVSPSLLFPQHCVGTLVSFGHRTLTVNIACKVYFGQLISRIGAHTWNCVSQMTETFCRAAQALMPLDMMISFDIDSQSLTPNIWDAGLCNTASGHWPVAGR